MVITFKLNTYGDLVWEQQEIRTDFGKHIHRLHWHYRFLCQRGVVGEALRVNGVVQIRVDIDGRKCTIVELSPRNL